jgi:hypothetical protein
MRQIVALISFGLNADSVFVLAFDQHEIAILIVYLFSCAMDASTHALPQVVLQHP